MVSSDDTQGWIKTKAYTTLFSSSYPSNTLNSYNATVLNGVCSYGIGAISSRIYIVEFLKDRILQRMSC